MCTADYDDGGLVCICTIDLLHQIHTTVTQKKTHSCVGSRKPVSGSDEVKAIRGMKGDGFKKKVTERKKKGKSNRRASE